MPAQEGWANSNFSLGVEFDGTLISLVKMAPAAIVATLYRPFIWESHKPSTLLSSLESLAIMLLTLKILWLFWIEKISFFTERTCHHVVHQFFFIVCPSLWGLPHPILEPFAGIKFLACLSMWLRSF
jgi:hypothetical protein